MSISPSTVRHDLALPNELLHKVILWVLSENIHSLCTSTADTSWEKNMMAVLHQVSPAFKAISSELAAKAFDIPRDIRNDDAALLRTLREKFFYLSHLGSRFRNPSECSTLSFQTIDCSASSFVFAYALYLTCTSLRRHGIRSTRDVFETSHKVILSGLEKSEILCARVNPAEMTSLLRKSVLDERNLAILGLNMVQGFNDLQCYGDALELFQLHAKDGTGPITGARHLIHSALSKVEGAYESYEDILDRNPSQSEEPRAYDLPGVIRGLERLTTLTIDQDQFDLRKRIRNVVKVRRCLNQTVEDVKS